MHLIDLAKPHMAKSVVVDSKTGKSKDSRFVLQTPFIACICMSVDFFQRNLSLFF